MRVCSLIFIIGACSAADVINSYGQDSKIEDEETRLKFLRQLVQIKTVLLDDYHLVLRQVATDVFKFRNYRSVSVVFYPIMRDVVDAQFTFLAEELHLNNIGSCKPRDVIIQMKHGSYPALNPDGYSFPKYFIDPDFRERIYTVSFPSNGKNITYSIQNPKPGNWYALVYVKWEDPRTENIEQQGLSPTCRTTLYTDLQIKKDENISIEDCYEPVHLNFTEVPVRFKCMSKDTADPVTLNITVANVPARIGEHDAKFSFKVSALALPTSDDYLIHCIFDATRENTISFTSHPNAWHYIQIDYVYHGNTSQVADCESYFPRAEDDVPETTVLDLMRDDKGRFFSFEYGLPTEDLNDVTSLVNLTADSIKALRFKVNQFIDTGGNLIIETSILMSFGYYMGYKRKVHKSGLVPFTTKKQYFKVVICSSIEYPTVPLVDGTCKFNDAVVPALFVLNSTDSDSVYDKVIIPYPEAGLWYLTLRLFCDDSVCPCTASDDGNEYYVDMKNRKEEFKSDTTDTDLNSNNTWDGSNQCNASLVLFISSAACIAGSCENHGSCMLNTVGGFVMSFCSCPTGYGAWDCSDDSRMESQLYMLLSVLYLTLSNLVFMFSIYVAVIRWYYLEAIMYTFTMVFSTMYHACDAAQQVAYCIFRGDILQFGDFYSGIMSFWVTLLAMSIINDSLKSSLQLFGATVIALLTTWNMHALTAFIVPVAVGVAVLLLSWYVDYKKLRVLRYPRFYYVVYFPIGLVLVGIGLICFAFLQTEQNYRIVHSFWHMIVALCVGFLLPDVRRGEGVRAFEPKGGFRNCCKRIVFCRNFRSPTSTPETESD